MTALSWLAAKRMGLPKPTNRDVAVERDLAVPMPDGAQLLADRWYPVGEAQTAPIILMRTPYGRRGPMGLMGRMLAERGYTMVIQSCRGTFGSGGDWNPLFDEQSDGASTFDWLEQQPWFTGTVGLFGISYSGISAWAAAADAPSYVKAMANSVVAAGVRGATIHPGGSFGLATAALWFTALDMQESAGPLRSLTLLQRAAKTMNRAASTLPLGRVDQVAIGKTVPYYQEWLAHDAPEDPWWRPVDFASSRAKVSIPVAMHGGWYDLYTPATIEDYSALRGAGVEVALTLGPWTHTQSAQHALTDALQWFDVQLRKNPSRRRAAVNVFVMGAERWIELDSWPPASAMQSWHLHADAGLSTDQVSVGPPDRYRYDPADPTPSLGGASLHDAGPVDNKLREVRSDVLTYTSASLEQPLTVVGNLTAHLYVRCSRPDLDLFVRLCEVSPGGRSVNRSDGIVRLSAAAHPVGADDIRRVRIDMWPTATQFQTGQRLRLQVSSGAHPLYARNLGGGEPLPTATECWANDVEIFRDPERPSRLELPVLRVLPATARRL